MRATAASPWRARITVPISCTLTAEMSNRRKGGPERQHLLNGHPAAGGQLPLDARDARVRLERPLNGRFDGKALRGGKPLGESLGFPRKIDHAQNFAQLAVKAQKFLDYTFVPDNLEIAADRGLHPRVAQRLREADGQATPRRDPHAVRLSRRRADSRDQSGARGALTALPMHRIDVWRMIRRRAEKAGIDAEMCCHTFRATGLTNFLANGGTLKNAQAMAYLASPRTTQLYDRTGDEITLDEFERIAI